MDNIYKLNSFYLLYIIIGSLTIFFYKADSRSHIERSRNVRPFDYRAFAIQQQHQQHQQHYNFNHPQTAKSLLMYKAKGPIYLGAAAVPMYFYDKLLAMPRYKKYSYGNILLYGEKQRKSISPTRDIVVPYNLVKTYNTNINPKYIPVKTKNRGPFFRTKSMYDEMPSPNLRGDTVVKMVPQCNPNGLSRSGVCSTTETPRIAKSYSDTTQSKLLLNNRFVEKNNEIISTESSFKEHHNASPSNQQFTYQLTPPMQPYSSHSYFTLDDVIIPSTYNTYHYNRSQIPEFNNNLPMYRKKEPTPTEEPFTFLDFFSNVDSKRKTTTTSTTTTSTTTQSIPVQKYTEYNIVATQATIVDPFERKPQTTSYTNFNLDDFYEYKDFQSNWIPKTTKDTRVQETTTTTTTILPTNTMVNLITTNSNTDIIPYTDSPTSTKETPVVTTIATKIKKTSIKSMERPEFRQRLRTKFQETYQKKQRDKSLSSIRNNLATSQTTYNSTLPSVKVTKRKYQRNSKLSRLKFPRKETFTIDNPIIGKSKRPKNINTNGTESKYSRIRSIFTVDAKNKTDSVQLFNDLRSSVQIKNNDTLASDIQTISTTTTTTSSSILRPTRKFSKRRQFSTTPSPTRDMREVLQSRKKSGTTDLPLPVVKKPTVKENLTTEKYIPEVKRPIQVNNSKTTRKPNRSESAIMTITSNHDNNSEKSSTSINKKLRKFTNNPIYRNVSSITEVPPLPIEVYFRKTNQAEI